MGFIMTIIYLFIFVYSPLFDTYRYKADLIEAAVQ